MSQKPLRAGDVVQLIAPGYDEPDGLCTVVADQEGSSGLVWFTPSESSSRRLPIEILPILAEAFPAAFFVDPKQVQPLKIDIHQDLLAALPEGFKPTEAKRLLHWYVHRAAYLKALLHGQGRIDLIGAVVESEIPDFIREQARERFLELDAARRKAKAGKPPGKRPATKPGQPRPAAPAPPDQP